MSATQGNDRKMVELTSPGGRLVVRLRIENVGKEHGALLYDVERDGRAALLPSRLGLWLGGAPPLISNFRIVDSQSQTIDQTWTPVVGERSNVRDHCREGTLVVEETIPPRRTLTIQLRAYDHAAAVRYDCQPPDGGSLVVTDDRTQWRFPPDCQGYDGKRAQCRYTLKPIDAIGSDCQRPLTVVYPDGRVAAIGEAGNVDAPRMKLRSISGRADKTWTMIPGVTEPDTLEAELSGPARGDGRWISPWRFILLGDRPGALIEGNDLLMNLSPPCRLDDTAWLRPGKVIREVTLSREGAEACIDFARRHGIKHISFDAGWYGHVYHDHTDATTIGVDPLRRERHPGLADTDLPAIVKRAAEHDIGVWCYVDRRHLERQLDDILDRFAEWGLAGIKFGFVQVGDQAWTAWLHHAVAAAARRQLMVDIHDEYRTTGITRTWPNLVTVEGIYGNEEFPDATHNVTLPFTRFVAGPADYTICIAAARLQHRRLHQLAMAVVYFSPLQFVYWYDRPQDVPDDPALEFLDEVPTVWDDTKVLVGEIGRHIVMARRSGDTWYLGAMTNEQPSALSVDLTFLEGGRYEATIYRDPGEVSGRTVIESQPVDATTTLPIHMPGSSGWCAIIRGCHSARASSSAAYRASVRSDATMTSRLG